MCVCVGEPVQCTAWLGQCILYILIMMFEKVLIMLVLLIPEWKKVRIWKESRRMLMPLSSCPLQFRRTINILVLQQFPESLLTFNPFILLDLKRRNGRSDRKTGSHPESTKTFCEYIWWSHRNASPNSTNTAFKLCPLESEECQKESTFGME